MNIIEHGISLIAPHVCISCGVDGGMLCSACIDQFYEPLEPRCAGCRKLSSNFSTCQSCARWLKAKRVYVANRYEGIAEVLVHSFKFDMKRSASIPMAQIMQTTLADYFNQNDQSNTLLCSIPTAPERIRQRSFDHAWLLARELGRHCGLRPRRLLKRRTNARQVGSTRHERIRQMEHEFNVEDADKVVGKTILLVDDVLTTGSTIAAASKALKKAGAKEVIASIFAQK